MLTTWLRTLYSFPNGLTRTILTFQSCFPLPHKQSHIPLRLWLLREDHNFSTFCLTLSRIFSLALQVMNLSASTGSLVAITIERYRAICLPFTPPLSKFQAKLIIAIVSMASFLVALPEVGAYKLGQPFGCIEQFPSVQLRKAYSLLLFLACYLLPLLFIAPAYTRMILRLWHDRDDFPSGGVTEDPKSHKRKRNVLKMMVSVVVCYAICMLPTYALFLWLDFGLTGY